MAPLLVFKCVIISMIRLDPQVFANRCYIIQPTILLGRVLLTHLACQGEGFTNFLFRHFLFENQIVSIYTFEVKIQTKKMFKIIENSENAYEFSEDLGQTEDIQALKEFYKEIKNSTEPRYRKIKIAALLKIKSLEKSRKKDKFIW